MDLILAFNDDNLLISVFINTNLLSVAFYYFKTLLRSFCPDILFVMFSLPMKNILRRFKNL